MPSIIPSFELPREKEGVLTKALTRKFTKSLTRSLTWLLAATLIFPASMWAGVKSDKVQVLASTETPNMREQSGSLSITQRREIIFRSDSGKTLTIACSAITHTSFATKSNMLKKVAVPAIGAAIFTMGLSLFALAIRGHGYFLAVDYGAGQQAMFSLGKDVYAQDVNDTSACTGKPTEILK